MTSNDCSVCAEKYHASNRKKVFCDQCNFEVCAKCVETYLKTSLTPPQCMKCNTLWNHEFVRKHFGSTFVKRIQDIQKEVLLREQIALIPYTQRYVNLQNERKQLKQESDDITIQIRELTERRRLIIENIYNVDTQIHNFENSTNSQFNNVTTKYLRKCNKENCKGYIREDNGVCELCKTEFCKHCMEEKLDNHICNENNVQTIRLLKKDTKNCPSCSTPIYRISGCPDMFCVNCKTAFNWNTLEINKRGNSNPHYYEWIRTNPNNISDSQFQSILRHNNYVSLTRPDQQKIMNCIRTFHHAERNIQYFTKNVVSYITVHSDNDSNDNFIMASLHSRAKFMRNEITESQFKTTLMKLHKAMEFNLHVLSMENTIRNYKQELSQFITNNKFNVKTLIDMSKDYASKINTDYNNKHKLYYNTSSYIINISAFYS